jgi:hypothetical protein
MRASLNTDVKVAPGLGRCDSLLPRRLSGTNEPDMVELRRDAVDPSVSARS